MKNKNSILESYDKYSHWLIFKYFAIAKKTRLTLEELEKIIIREIIYNKQLS